MHQSLAHPREEPPYLGLTAPAFSASRQSALDRAKRQVHPHCMACGSAVGVGLDFEALDDGSVVTEFDANDVYQGYSGFLHGGAIATLLDSAMTNCLFAHDRIAVTAELTVHYQLPVSVGRPCTIRARIERSFGPLFVMQSELDQDGQTCVTAKAKFMETTVPLRPAPSVSTAKDRRLTTIP